MRRALAFLTLGSLLAVTAQAQSVLCPQDTRIPVSLSVPSPCPGRPLELLATGCGPCVDLQGWIHEPGGPVTLLVELDSVACTRRQCEPESLSVPLGVHMAGHYELMVQIRGGMRRADSTECTFVRDQRVTFDVPRTCGSESPDSLDFIDRIRVGEPPPCATCPAPPICPDIGIRLTLGGQLPGSCYHFRHLELLPSTLATPLPQPPTVRAVFTTDSCLRIPCSNALVPWEAQTVLPGLPPGNYHVMVETALVSSCDSLAPPTTLGSSVAPFTVVPTCNLPPPTPCFLYQWRHDGTPDCDASVAAGTPARLVFSVAPYGALAGLQGRFSLGPPNLQIIGIAPIGMATGMHLAWEPTADGAKFVMFAEDGAPIASPCESIVPCPVPVLEVTVAERLGVPIPQITLIRPVELLGTDALGAEVLPCPTFAEIAPGRICAGASCDFNRDGRVDVRDLVLMVHCVRERATCSESTDERFDCNRDGNFDLNDVFCCARVILHGRMPDTTLSRPAPDVWAHAGTPVATSAGLDVPVTIERADLVGAARLVFSYPLGSFGAATAEVVGDPSRWLALSEAADGRAIVAAIALSPGDGREPLDLVLHFTTSGLTAAAATADVKLLESEFAGPDGVRLAARGSVPSAPTGIQLSAARPNPFTSETRFSLVTSSASDVEVGVFDPSGRRITTLFRGRLEAGSHAFGWNGLRGDGTRARSGVYFYRAQAGAASTTKKLVLLRGE